MVLEVGLWRHTGKYPATLKTALLREVTDEGLPAPKQRSLRRSDHRGIEANNQPPKISASSQTSHRPGT